MTRPNVTIIGIRTAQVERYEGRDGVQLRRLSMVGLHQAETRGEDMELGVKYVFIPRGDSAARETAELVFSTPEHIIEVPELWPPNEGPDGWVAKEAFQRLGYLSLNEYRADDRTGWLHRWATKALPGMQRQMGVRSFPARIGIVADFMYVNLVAVQLSDDHAMELYKLQLAEAEGFMASPGRKFVHITGCAVGVL